MIGNKMKRILFFALLASTFVFASDIHTFTDTSGRSINARIIEHDSSNGKVLIERAGRKAIWVNPDVFSEDDQVYIEKWISDSKFMEAALFDISVVEDKSSWTSSGDASGNRRQRTTYYTIVLHNNNEDPIDGLRVEYCVFRNRELGGDEFVESKIYTKDAGKIDAKSEKRIRGNGYVSFKNSGFLNEVEGLCVRVYMDSEGKTLTREMRFPEKLSTEEYVWGNTEDD